MDDFRAGTPIIDHVGDGGKNTADELEEAGLPRGLARGDVGVDLIGGVQDQDRTVNDDERLAHLAVEDQAQHADQHDDSC